MSASPPLSLISMCQSFARCQIPSLITSLSTRFSGNGFTDCFAIGRIPLFPALPGIGPGSVRGAILLLTDRLRTFYPLKVKNIILIFSKVIDFRQLQRCQLIFGLPKLASTLLQDRDYENPRRYLRIRTGGRHVDPTHGTFFLYCLF
jgi:hypothetical protein